MVPIDRPSEPVDVLLVEDSRTQAKLMERVLEQEPSLNLVAIAEDGVEAMAYLRREGQYSEAKCPRLVLLDIEMPRKNGFEVLNEMKADQQLRTIPVVMLTTRTAQEDIVKSYEDGASTYIPKPLQIKDLKEIFKRFGTYWAESARLPPTMSK